MTDRPSLAELAETAARDPESLDFGALCEYLSSDEYEVSSEATDVRDAVLRNVSEPATVAETLLDLVTVDDRPVASAAVETLSRLASVCPRELAPLLAERLDASDVRTRPTAADVLGRTKDGAVAPHLGDLVARLDDEDDRVAALALDGLSRLSMSYPERVAPHVAAVEPFLADRWIPTDDCGFQLVYTREAGEGDPSAGEPRGERLTNRVPRPYSSATTLLAQVAPIRPAALAPVVPRLVELVASPPEGTSPRTGFIGVLGHALRADVPAATDRVPELVPALRDLADAEERRTRVAARNLLEELGREPDRPPAVAVPEMATRDRPKAPSDDEFLDGIDQRVMMREADLDAVAERLVCADADVRDTTAWGLECGVEGYVDEIHERAETFLALLDEPDDCARRHLHNVLDSVASAYPEEWTPALLELATHDDPSVRAGALGAVRGAAGAYPALFADESTHVAGRLDDEPPVRAAAFDVLGTLADAFPEEAERYVAAAAATVETATLEDDALEADPSVLAALRYLESLAKVRPATVAAEAAPVVEAVRELAGAETIEARARWGREGSTSIGLADQALDGALDVCAWVAKAHPAAVNGSVPGAGRVVDGRNYGWKAALRLLETVDG